MAAIAMLHTDDPRQEIWKTLDAAGVKIEDIDLSGPRMLVAIYKRPGKTAGGILLTDDYRDEDIHQGKTCLVLKAGPSAVVDTAENVDRVAVGDWVVVRSSNGVRCTIGKQECRIISDTMVEMRVPRPDLVW